MRAHVSNNITQIRKRRYLADAVEWFDHATVTDIQSYCRVRQISIGGRPFLEWYEEVIAAKVADAFRQAIVFGEIY